jgi:hypothetical protein
MDGNDHVTTHTAWIRFVSAVVLTALIIGSLLLVAQLCSHVPSLHVLWPKSEIVTLTGYGRLSPMNPSSDPTSVVLTRSQALAFNRAVAALSMKGGPNCHENSVVFTLSIAPVGGQTPDWKVTEWECPAAWDSQCSIRNLHPDLSRASLLLDISCRLGPTQGSCEENVVNIQVRLRRRVTHKTPRLHFSRTASARWHSWALLPFKWLVLDGRRAQKYEA